MDYKVSFFKIEYETDEKGKPIKVGEDFLGSVVVDDEGTSDAFTLQAKAFRVCSDKCLTLADKTVVQKL